MPKRIFSVDTTPVTVVSVAANMANGTVAGNHAVLDNRALKATAALFTLTVPAFALTPTANTVFELWLARQDVVGTGDDTAGSTVTSTPAAPSGLASTDGMELVGVFPVAATTALQRVTRRFALRDVLLAEFVLRNFSGQTAQASVGSEVTVTATLCWEATDP